MDRHRCKVSVANIRIGRHLPVCPREAGLVAPHASGGHRRAGWLLCRHVSPRGGLLLQPALEAVGADPDPLAVLPRGVPGRAGHGIGRAPGAEHAAAVAAVVAPVQDGELRVAVVAHAAALVRHPEVPRQVMRQRLPRHRRSRLRRGRRGLLAPPRHPRLHGTEQLHKAPLR